MEGASMLQWGPLEQKSSSMGEQVEMGSMEHCWNGPDGRWMKRIPDHPEAHQEEVLVQC